MKQARVLANALHACQLCAYESTGISAHQPVCRDCAQRLEKVLRFSRDIDRGEIDEDRLPAFILSNFPDADPLKVLELACSLENAARANAARLSYQPSGTERKTRDSFD
jgi:hypothetical protein